MSSLPQSLIVRSVILQVPSPMGWSEAPIIQGEMVIDVLTSWTHTAPWGWMGSTQGY